jgi:hypothetical protein
MAISFAAVSFGGRVTVRPLVQESQFSQTVSAIRTASAQTGARFDDLLAWAKIESGLRPGAQASASSASGLFQFVDQTWLASVRQYGPAHGLSAEAAAIVPKGGRLVVDDPATRQRILGLRNDPQVASLLAGDHMRGLDASLTAALGHPPDATSMYLGHFLGPTGAVQILQAGANRPAASILPEAARANPALFTNPDGSPATVAQFVGRVRDRLASIYAGLGLQAPAAGTEAAPAAPDWGKGSPTRIASPGERLMDASLAEVFSRMDQAMTNSEQGKSRRSREGLPMAIVSALRTSDQAPVVAPDRGDGGGGPPPKSTAAPAP